jgi:stringent starvation protein B
VAQLPPKKDVANALLQGPSLYIHLDPRKAGVIVPKWLATQPQLILQVGLNLAVPIPDIEVGPEALSCTLSFNRAPFWCKMPWTAVYALVGEDGRGMIWPEDVPPELAAQSQKPALKVVGKKKAKKAKLQVAASPAEVPPPAAVASEAPDALADESAQPTRSAEDEAEDKATKRELPSYLRVVK